MNNRLISGHFCPDILRLRLALDGSLSGDTVRDETKSKNGVILKFFPMKCGETRKWNVSPTGKLMEWSLSGNVEGQSKKKESNCELF